jgi:hypothetical protein
MRYLDYPIERRLDAILIMNYIDTAKAYQVPEEWDHFHLLDDLNPEQAKRVYFSEPPREMYLISVGGMSTLGAVFDPNQIGRGGWITDHTEIPLDEQDRIIKRLEMFLDKIEVEAKKSGLPDSVIYLQDPFKNYRK